MHQRLQKALIVAIDEIFFRPLVWIMAQEVKGKRNEDTAKHDS